MDNPLLIYIRSELNPDEHRCPIIPIHVKKLIDNGYTIYVESSTNRIYNDNEYKNTGAIITNKKWYDNDFAQALIVGLKELSNLELLDNHIHIYFSHSYKNQKNAEKILRSFAMSKSTLYDFEYFLDDNNKRIIAFGFYAGYIGCCLGLLQYFTKQNKKSNISKLRPWNSKTELLSEVTNMYEKDILIAVIGANGNTGKSVISLLTELGINYVSFNRENNKVNLEYYDIIFNCIKLDEKYNDTWFHYTTNFIKPITIVDISCDYTRTNNPIKLYNNPTTLDIPVLSCNKYVDIIAIDNLPSLLPKDSSNEFSEKFLNLLLNYDNDIWKNNKKIYSDIINKYSHI
jgi:saccharopine dehydrogenase (NAD+, L-lysine-forming)